MKALSPWAFRFRQAGLTGKSLGFYKGKVDGSWGPVTKGALAACQAKSGLAADGIWGPRSEAVVRERLG